MIILNSDNLNNIALISSKYGNITYGECVEYGERLKNKLHKHNGLAILRAANRLGSVLSYIALVECNIPVLLVDSSTSDEDFMNIIEEYCPDYIVDNTIKTLGGFQQIEDIFSYSVLRREVSLKVEINPDLALLLPTSGSTGSRKYVRVSRYNILSNTNSITQYLKISSSDVAITSMPMSYTYGLSVINTHLKAGGKVVITESTVFDRDFWRLLDECQVTSISGVPYFWQLLLKAGFDRRDITSLRYITQAGGRLDTKTKRKLLKFSSGRELEFYVMYGQTEATARMSYVPSDMLESKIESIGIAIPGGEFEILDPDSDSGIGELVYKGANVTLGYAKSSDDLAKGDERLGILRTGDMARVDIDGYYYVVGRNKRFGKVFGVRISLDELEGYIEEKFESHNFLISTTGESLMVQYTGDLDQSLLLKSLIKKTNINISAFKLLQVDNIKRNTNGKKVYI